MMPNEFWNSTYRDVRTYVDSCYRTKKESYKEQVLLLNALGNKIIGAVAYKRPKNKSMMDMFQPLFKEEMEHRTKTQPIEEMIRNLRARM